MQKPNLRILIIDDNPEIHKDIIKILHPKKNTDSKLLLLKKELFGEDKNEIVHSEFEIDSASRGEIGIKMVEDAKNKQRPYAMAFVDVRMPPGLDGIETIQKIWTIDKDIQIVICTAYSDYSWERMVEKLGEHENLLVLKKPFDSLAVRQLSSALTTKWRLQHEMQTETHYLKEKMESDAKKIQFQLTHDPLTKLPNRNFLLDYMNDLIVRSEREMGRFTLMYIDIDRFKLINESFSRLGGDELLIKLADRIKKNLRSDDFLARMDTDKFVLIANRFDTKEAVKKLAYKILEGFEIPINVQNHDIIVSLSIGVSIFPYDGKTYDELLLNADRAVIRAKKFGGNQIQFYTVELNQKSFNQLATEVNLRRAVKNNEFFLVYQPQYNLTNNKIFATEALIRWNHPEKGLIMPIDFIPLAEEIGLFVTLGEWVIREACEQAIKWKNLGYPLIMAVNVTMHQFSQPNIVEMISAILNETKLAPEFLELELTENILISNIEAINNIRQLKELGINIAIDDFGTGYSSLNYLRKIPIDKLKIDQSFVKNIGLTNDEVIIQAVITIAKGLNIKVVAEGVETETQLKFLRDNGCHYVQGFYFSKAVNPDVIVRLLKEEKKDNT